ncbi:hypothetical protein Q5P01_000769 [Channa striata]|uniref:Uncharacterized protein n=1 Tax=Channa striata TaxID=64152 RepID=A0AA88IWY0_CHASR|nr:hypothetical protein Q5P01_000769 [Channa striata]
MQRGRAGIAGGFDSLISTGKELFGSKLSATPGSILSAARFRGKLGAAIAVITSLIVGFLTMPNNILYFIDSRHGTRGYGGGAERGAERGRPEYEYAYIHAGIALITLGCLAMVVSIVLSFFAATSKRKMDDSGGEEPSKSTRTVFACLIVMNVELFMSVVAGCMELLYRPLIQDANTGCTTWSAPSPCSTSHLRHVRCHHGPHVHRAQGETRRGPRGSRKGATEIAIAPNSSRDNRFYYSSRGSGNPYYSQSSGVASIGGHLEVHDTVGHCQHGKPCAIACPSDKDGGASLWPGLVPEDELWWGEEWKDVQIKGESPTMISPGVMIADRLRNPSLAGCRNWSTVIPWSWASAAEIQCEGFGWGLFDEVFWLTSPCREEGACKNDFVGEEAGRLFERDNVNTTLVENALGDPLSKTLVLDPVVESDLKGAFFCKLESTRRNDVVSVFLEARRDGTEGTTNNGHRESEPRAATRGPR